MPTQENKISQAMLTHKDICRAVKEIAPGYGIKNAFYFGSYASGTQNKNSDLDLLVEFENNGWSLFTLGGIISDLEDMLHKEINVVTLPLKKDSRLIIEKAVKCYGSKQRSNAYYQNS
ncbi:MAG: nucleotidyltransferase domain-containing protein [Gracilibacteraceae bacterium]|jgi:predicted nucleotidyltransferase|nr:nucleotidyltransferase domain-containing protein [Gracilibacteraceae bacterium]